MSNLINAICRIYFYPLVHWLPIYFYKWLCYPEVSKSQGPRLWHGASLSCLAASLVICRRHHITLQSTARSYVLVDTLQL